MTGENVKKKGRKVKKRENTNVHLDGVKRIRCPQGITERDVNNFFQRQQTEWGHTAAQGDHELHVQALQLLRAHKASAFLNAELTIIGDYFAVRLVAGKGRTKFRIEHLPQKVKVQIQVENLVVGFVRLLLFLCLLLETACSVLSLASLHAQDSESESEEDTPVVRWTLLTFCTALGDVFRAILACLAAMETINSSPALFAPTYGRGRATGGGKDDVGNHGVGVWPLGGRRWLFRGVMYAAVASGGRLHIMDAERFMLPQFVVTDGLRYSSWVLMAASALSIILHVLHVCLPSLLKSPWTSVSRPSLPSAAAHPDSAPSSSAHSSPGPTVQDKAKDIEADMDGAIPAAVYKKVHTDDAENDVSNDVISRRPLCCSALFKCKRRPCTLSLGLTSVSFILCAVVAFTLFACHLARLLQTFVLQSTLVSMETLPPSASAVVLCAVCCSLQVMGGLQTLLADRVGAPLTPRASMLLNVASLSTLWSREVVTWLMEVQGLKEGQVGIVLIAGSVTSLLIPAVLLVTQHLLTCRGRGGRGCRACVSWRPVRPWAQHVQSAVFMGAVLLALSGMALAVLSLSLPLARVKSQYQDSLAQAVGNLSRVLLKAEDHYKRMLELFDIDVCGGPDLQQLKRELTDSRQAAASLTVSQLRDHCDQMGLHRAVKAKDPFCQRYGAASLYFKGDLQFSSALHNPDIKSVKSANSTVQSGYLDRVIRYSRGQQLRTLDEGETELTPGAYKVYEECLVGLCIAENVALVAMAIPFYGIAGQLVYLTAVAVGAVVRLLTKLSKLQVLFLDFKLSLEILMAKFTYYEEDKTLQFSLANFNLIYIAYPALLTGCLGILVGFWYRKGAAVSHRRRAALVVVMPLVIFNLFGVGMTYAWHHIVNVLGEAAPMIQMTVTPLSALVVLRISYVLTLLSCLLFLLLAFLHHRQLRIAGKGGPADVGEDSDSDNAKDGRTGRTKMVSSKYQYAKVEKTSTFASQGSELTVFINHEKTSTTETRGTKLGFAGDRSHVKSSGPAKMGETTEKSKPPTLDKTANKGVKVTQGAVARGTTWVLALLLSLATAFVVSVIIWKPVFAFDFDFNADMKHILQRVGKRLESSASARDSIYSVGADRCRLVDFFAKLALERYMEALKNMVIGSFTEILNAIDIKVQVTAMPSLQLIQIPLLLAVYVPLLVIAWSVLASQLKPAWAFSPRFCSRLTSSMAWLSLGWLVNGVLFLTTVSQAGVVPMFRVQVYTGDGFAFAMAANVGLLLVSQELRIGTISPVL